MQLEALAHADPFLLSVIVCVASHYVLEPGMREIHERSYALIRETLADYACAGFQPTIGFVEGVLILAENLPRDRLGPMASAMAGPRGEVQGLHGTENRRAWALVGTAIRAAYGLGLDRLALEDIDGERDADLERARGVWTWCYLYDRTLGLRTGLAFWSRGPALCFQGFSDISQTGEAAARENFPYMLLAGAEETYDSYDSASMMQATIELTQIMTNAHEVLFSTPSRTSALVAKGEYYKFLDHFRRALESFCQVWKGKRWRLDSVRELVWCTYHFVRLYVAAFAFQAHVQRAQRRAEKERELREQREQREQQQQGYGGGDDAQRELSQQRSPRGAPVISIFPRGTATSPDAVYIYESIDAAHEILRICLRLGELRILSFLPSRYLINFAYSGTFALKAAYSGALGGEEIDKTISLVEQACAALLSASQDKDHPAVRYGQMLRMLSSKLCEMNDQSVSGSAPRCARGGARQRRELAFASKLAANTQAIPSRFPSPEPAAPADPMIHVNHVPAFDGENGAGAGSATASDVFHLNNINPGLFDTELDVGSFNLDGFWEDFTLTDSGGFPFR